LLLENNLNVNTIKPVPSASTKVPSNVPGNAPNFYNNKYKCTQENHWCSCTHFDNHHSGAKSACAYPLVKDDQKIGEVIKSPLVKLPNNKCFTPTTITVVDTISSVKLQTLLKVLFDP
jgi:hypothetical protein